MYPPGHCRLETNWWHNGRRRWWRIKCNTVKLPHVSFTGEKTLQYKVHNITIIVPVILAGSRWWHFMSAQTRCAEVCKYIFDRQVGQPIRTEHFDWTNIFWSYAFHSLHKYIYIYINTFRPPNFVIAIGMWRNFQPAKKRFLNQITYPAFKWTTLKLCNIFLNIYLSNSCWKCSFALTGINYILKYILFPIVI